MIRAADTGAFDAFVADVEPALRQALVATFGPVDGREATVDALSWAWEHWERLDEIDNPVGYLYRVGQSAVRRFGARAVPADATAAEPSWLPEIDPGLIPALRQLSDQQRTVVLLVLAFEWPQAEVARLLGVSPSTVHEYLARGLDRLRRQLEVRDVK